MKSISLILFFCVTALAAFAQSPAGNRQYGMNINPMKDNTEYHGYTITLLPVPPVTGAYAFDIRKGNKPVFHKIETGTSGNIWEVPCTKEAVYVIAKRIVDDYQRTGIWPTNMPGGQLNRQLHFQQNQN